MLKAAGTQHIRTYIDRRQATVVQWVDLRPIFEVFAQEDMGCTVGWRIQAPWWQQTTEDSQLRATLQYISSETRERTLRESINRGKR